jgi:putative Holliday junction resolvase
MGKILGLDIGKNFIGCVIADKQGITIEPLPPIKRTNESLALGQLRRLFKKYIIDIVVVGYPLQNGCVSAQTKKVKSYINKIKKHFPELTIVYHDETLSTWATRKKFSYLHLKKSFAAINIDSFSAMEIVKDYLYSTNFFYK